MAKSTKTQLSISDFFRHVLRAPLVNDQWSWGAVRQSDKSVFLRVWEDDFERDFVRLTKEATAADRLGYDERMEQIRSLADGSKCFLVVCYPQKEFDAYKYKVENYKDDKVFPTTGKPELRGSDYWIRKLTGIRPQDA